MKLLPEFCTAIDRAPIIWWTVSGANSAGRTWREIFRRSPSGRREPVRWEHGDSERSHGSLPSGTVIRMAKSPGPRCGGNWCRCAPVWENCCAGEPPVEIPRPRPCAATVSYTHLRAHETDSYLV